jgi:hypothetical protein
MGLLILLGGGSAPPAVSQGFDFDLSSYLGAKLAFDIYPGHLPQQSNPAVEVMPAYTYAQVYAEHVALLSGGAGLCEANYQVDAWSYLDDQVVAMTQALFKALHGFRGTMGLTKVQGCLLHNQLTLDEAPAGIADQWVFHRVSQFKIFYVETIPTFP